MHLVLVTLQAPSSCETVGSTYSLTQLHFPELLFLYIYIYSGFSGLEVACWPLVPKFMGSNPAEAVRFLGRKNPQHTFLQRGSKAVSPMS